MTPVLTSALGAWTRAAAVALALTGGAQAAEPRSLAEQVAVQLRAQGYERIETGRSWLGRIWVRGYLDTARREIVLNPNTGEILRDYTTDELQMADRDDDDDDTASRTAVVAGGEVTVTRDHPNVELLDIPDGGDALVDDLRPDGF